MTILHLVRSSAYNGNDLNQCISNIQTDDTLVLLDDGCYNITHPLLAQCTQMHPELAIYFIENHADARAINVNQTISTPITMDTLIKLTFSNDTVVTWQ